MKKFFLLALSLPLFACQGYRVGDARFENDVQIWPDGSHTIKEHNEYNSWPNILTQAKAYPLQYYTQSRQPSRPSQDLEEVTALREYPRNVLISANLGQRMIDSEVLVNQTNVDDKNLYRVEQNGIISDSYDEVHLFAGQTLYPLGAVDIEGKHYLIFDPLKNGRLILTDENGRFMPISGSLQGNEFVVSRATQLIRPYGLKVSNSSQSKTAASQSKMQYEIKYDGLKDGNISFIFIDYQNGIPYEQNFIFPPEQNIVNMHGIKFKITKATAGNIEYMILN